jgi:hypothetical protein
MRDVTQLTISFFERSRSLLQLLDQISDAFIVNPLSGRFLIVCGACACRFLSHES